MNRNVLKCSFVNGKCVLGDIAYFNMIFIRIFRQIFLFSTFFTKVKFSLNNLYQQMLQ